LTTESVSIVLVTSIVSTKPAALVVISNSHGSAVSTISYETPEALTATAALFVSSALMLSPLYTLIAEPNFSVAIVSVISCVVVVVCVMEPVVKLGVTDCAATGVAMSNNRKRRYIFYISISNYLIVSFLSYGRTK